MNTVLIVDDDHDILDLVGFNLNKAGFRCLTASDGPGCLERIRLDSPDLVVLDVMLPGMNGFEILRRLRFDVETRQIPVIMLTAKGEEVDRVIGLELGADDYVTKPFSVRELVLRVERVLSRKDQAETGSVLKCNGITLDSSRYEVKVQGEMVHLTTTEFNLLAYLLRNRGRVVTRDRLLEQVWGYRYGGTTRTVDTHIQRLRDKLGPESSSIETIRGIGYRVEAARTVS